MIDSAYALTAENMLRTLPSALQNDERLVALANSIAQTLEKRSEEIRRLQIYNRIDDLPEDLLDIIARDFKIDWYDYDYNLSAKRRVIKSSFYVHRHLGTVGAVRAAINSIYPESKVEEWFDYGGNPYSFRVVLNMSVAFVVPIDTERVLWAINFYKSLRSHVDGIFYQSSFQFAVACKTGYIVYDVRRCGTHPQIATQGSICGSSIILETDANGTAYTNPRANEVKTGSYPDTATQGGIADGSIVLATSINGTAYAHPRTGTLESGIFPTASTQGGVSAADIEVATGITGVSYSPTRITGEHPETATQGASEHYGIAAEETGLGCAYDTKVCGSAPGSFL